MTTTVVTIVRDEVQSPLVTQETAMTAERSVFLIKFRTEGSFELVAFSAKRDDVEQNFRIPLQLIAIHFYLRYVGE